MAYRPIAIVKWNERKYAVLQYEEHLPGLYFGIALLSTCTQTNWFANVGTGTRVQTWQLKFDATGTIRFICNYNYCVVSVLAKFVQSFLDKNFIFCVF